MRTRHLAPTMIAMLALHATAPADEPYFMGLGLLPGTESTRPDAMSGDGSIVVGWSPGGCDRSFRWTLETGITELDELSSWCGHGAAGISANGRTIAGNSGWGPPAIYVVTEPDGFVLVPEVEGLWSVASGLSRDGRVIVGTVWVPNSSPPVAQAARWLGDGGSWTAHVLGDLPGGYTQGDALATSHDGSVVVGSGMISFDFVEEAFRWTAEDGMQGLGGPPGYVESFATACSADGSVVAGYYTPGWTGFRWTAETGMVALGEIPGGGGTRVRAISADGSVIGGGSGSNNAFIWDEEHGVRRLSDVLEQEYGLDLQGFNLCCLEALSSDGRTMTGRGLNADGVPEGWIAHLGNPCAADVTGDGDIGVDDLLAVILAWDTADAGTDVDGDGVVGVDDLVQVISTWGQCDDCNHNGVPDADDIAGGTSSDCDADGVPDECSDCNGNGQADACDLDAGSSPDCNGNGVPDECDIAEGTSQDCNGNGVPDSCDLDAGVSADCNGNGIPDDCDIGAGTSQDCNANGVPDGCENDCNCNGVDDGTDIESGTSGDCNANDVPDECETPANDECGSAVTLGLGARAFCSFGATGAGPEEPECAAGVEADVWFRHLSQCDGLLVVTVDADFPPQLVVYSGPCPSAPGQAIACGAESAPNQAQVALATTAGTLLRFRVGSADGSTGAGTITVTCE